MTTENTIKGYDLINVREDGFMSLLELIETLKSEYQRYGLPVSHTDLDKYYQTSLKAFMQMVFPYRHQKLISDFRKKWHIPEWQGFMQYSESTYLSPEELQVKLSSPIEGDKYYYTVQQEQPCEMILGYPVHSLRETLSRNYIPDTSVDDIEQVDEWKSTYGDVHQTPEFLEGLIEMVSEMSENTHLNPVLFYNVMLDFIMYGRVSAFHFQKELLYSAPAIKEIDGDLYIKVVPTMSVQEYTDHLKQVLPSLLVPFEGEIREFQGRVQDKFDPISYRESIRTHYSKEKQGDYKLLNDRVFIMRKNHPEWFPEKAET